MFCHWKAAIGLGGSASDKRASDKRARQATREQEMPSKVARIFASAREQKTNRLSVETLSPRKVERLHVAYVTVTYVARGTSRSRLS